MAVFDAVGRRFLGNAIEMHGDGIVCYPDIWITAKMAYYWEECFQVLAQLFEGGLDVVLCQNNRTKAARQMPCLRQGLTDEGGDLPAASALFM